jgi:DNA-binding MarR family transcriptional regulator
MSELIRVSTFSRRIIGMNKQNSDEQNPVYESDYQLWVMMDHLRYLIFLARREELAGYGITPEQANILYVLRSNENSCTINEIMDYTQRKHNSISTLVNRMEKKGLVNKKKASKGRKLNIELTVKGQELIKKMKRDSFSQIFECLSEEDKQVLIAYLCRLINTSYTVAGKTCTPLHIDMLD